MWAAPVKPPAGYQVQSISGFTVLIPNEVLHVGPDRWQRKPLQVLENDLDDLRRVVGPKMLPIVTAIPIWVNWHVVDRDAPSVVAVYYGGTGKSLEQLGRQPLKSHCIEVLSLKRLGELRPPGSKFQQVITLHEMAHAVQHRLLGLDSADVNAAFQQAVDRKLYDNVPDRTGWRGQAYARTNAAEYFAELSCAYLDSCHYFPFTYGDLQYHDPAGFALMERVWKNPEQWANQAAKVATPEFTVTVIAKTPSVTAVGPAAEQIAFVTLDRAKAMMKAGQTTDAKRTLETLTQNYPTTIAAGEARKLLASLR
jgi:hypothetical protein